MPTGRTQLDAKVNALDFKPGTQVTLDSALTRRQKINTINATIRSDAKAQFDAAIAAAFQATADRTSPDHILLHLAAVPGAPATTLTSILTSSNADAAFGAPATRQTAAYETAVDLIDFAPATIIDDPDLDNAGRAAQIDSQAKRLLAVESQAVEDAMDTDANADQPALIKRVTNAEMAADPGNARLQARGTHLIRHMDAALAIPDHHVPTAIEDEINEGVIT